MWLRKGRKREEAESALRLFVVNRVGLEVELQLELGGAWAALVEGARATLRAVRIEGRVVVRTRDVAGNAVGGGAGRVHVQEGSGEAAEVGEVEDVVEGDAGRYAQTLAELGQANGVREDHIHGAEHRVLDCRRLRRGGNRRDDST